MYYFASIEKTEDDSREQSTIRSKVDLASLVTLVLLNLSTFLKFKDLNKKII